MKSKYTPFLLFHPETEGKIGQYQQKLSAAFFASQKITKYKEIPINESISDIDFYSKSKDKLEMPVIYTFLFDNFNKNVQGKFDHTIMFSFAYDEILCPFKMPTESEEIRYGKIELAGVPVFYYLYLDIKKVFEIIKS